MERVRAMPAAKMLSLENELTTGAALSGNNLVLTKQDGSTVDTGNVKGVVGPSGAGVVGFFSATSAYDHYTMTNQWWPIWNWTFAEGDSTLVDLIQREYEETVPGTGLSSYYRDFWIKTTGLYLIDYNVSFDNTMPINCRRYAAIHRNGVEIRRSCGAAGTIGYSSTEVAFPYSLVAGDKLTTMVFQDSGDAYNTALGPHRFNIVRIS